MTLRRIEEGGIEPNSWPPPGAAAREQVAITFVTTSPFKTHVVSAARSGEEAAANCEAASMDLTVDERRWLEFGT